MSSKSHAEPDCFLCAAGDQLKVADDSHAFAVADGFPVSDGHTLVVPKRHFPTFFEATEEERLAIFALLDEVKKQLDATHTPDGYNIGVNSGQAAGQTINHLHVHLIPRYIGDTADPVGGVRGVVPGKANYHAKDFQPAKPRNLADRKARRSSSNDSPQ